MLAQQKAVSRKEQNANGVVDKEDCAIIVPIQGDTVYLKPEMRAAQLALPAKRPYTLPASRLLGN